MTTQPFPPLELAIMARCFTKQRVVHFGHIQTFAKTIRLRYDLDKLEVNGR